MPDTFSISNDTSSHSPSSSASVNLSSTQFLDSTRGKGSAIWQFSRPGPFGPEKPWIDPDGTKWWHCQPCYNRLKEKKYKCSGGTGTITDHLAKEHKIILANKQDLHRESVKRKAAMISTWMEKGSDPSIKHRKSTAEEDSLDPTVLREIYGRYLVAMNLPINHCEAEETRVWLQYLRPAANDLLPKSHNTIAKDLRQSFDDKKRIIQKALQSAITNIHVSPDAWTGPNNEAILGITVQFVTERLGLQRLVLGLKEIQGSHTGSNMADILAKLFEEYGIERKIGYFMMDGASNNNTMIDDISQYLENEHEIKDWCPLTHRLRCNGHVINLVILAFLFDAEPATTDDRGRSVHRGPPPTELSKWRKLGPIGKLHNIVVYLQSSTLRRQAFEKLSNGLTLRRDNTTRWNSWYNIIERALRLQGAVSVWITGEEDLINDHLTPGDWKILADIYKFLQPFADCTLATEGHNDLVDSILPTMDFLLDHMETFAAELPPGPFKAAVNTAWNKLADYYALTEDTAVYASATVLHPSQKWRYIETTWSKPHEISKAKAKVLEMWVDDYKPKTTTATTTMTTIQLPIDCTDSPMDGKRENVLMKWKRAKQRSCLDPGDEDEYQLYCREPLVDVASPLDWWLQLDQRRRYPQLSIMALDILSVPAMSAETERLFSQAKLTITDQRTAMSVSMLHTIQCLKSWNKSPLLNDQVSYFILIRRLLTCLQLLNMPTPTPTEVVDFDETGG